MKILFVTARFPFPPVKGDRLRSFHMIRTLSKHHTVDLLTFVDSGVSAGQKRIMGRYCGRLETVPLSKTRSLLNLWRTLFNLRPFQVNFYWSVRMRETLREMVRTGGYDAVQIVLLRMMPYADAIPRELILLDHIDALSLNMARRAAAETHLLKRALFWMETRLTRWYEARSKNRYVMSIITSDVDRDHLGHPHVQTLANGVDGEFFAPVRTEKDLDFLFTGNMNYYPNVNAMLHMARDIWPLILARFPDATLHIAGINPAPEIRALEKIRNITVTGFVDDLPRYLSRAKIFAAPLLTGSGIQNKILEAMSCGLPVITTSTGNAGLKAVSGEHLTVADSADAFASAAIELYGNPSLRKRLGDSAREFVLRQFSWERGARELEMLYEKIRGAVKSSHPLRDTP